MCTWEQFNFNNIQMYIYIKYNLINIIMYILFYEISLNSNGFHQG